MEYHNNALRFDALTFENDNPTPRLYGDNTIYII